MTLQRFAPMEKIHFKKTFCCVNYWNAMDSDILFSSTWWTWYEKKSCTVYSLVFMIEVFKKRIELDVTVLAVQSGFAYPLLLISLRHSKWIFKPPFHVIFTGLSRSCTVTEPSKWCESNIRECNLSLHLHRICLPAVSECYWRVFSRNNLWY